MTIRGDVCTGSLALGVEEATAMGRVQETTLMFLWEDDDRIRNLNRGVHAYCSVLKEAGASSTGLIFE